jgi:hypothetical protein
MFANRYFLIFIVSLAVLGLCKKLFLNSCKNARVKNLLYATLAMLNALLIVGFVWSLADFRIHWVIFTVFFLPVLLSALLNIISTKFCESCTMTIHNWKFWQAAEKCPVCEQSSAKQNL